MNLQDLPLDILVEILDNLNTRELLIFACASKDSHDLLFVLNQIQIKPIVLRVESTESSVKYLGPKEEFDNLTLIHSSSRFNSIPYENSSNLFFDTIKYFNNAKQRTITLQFELDLSDDMSCMRQLLVKCETLAKQNFKFQLSLFKFLRRTELSKFSLPSTDLEKFNWSRVTIDTNCIMSNEPIFEEFLDFLPNLSISWLKHSAALSYIHIGERFKLQEDLNDLYFPNLKQVKFEICHRQSCENWFHFIVRHNMMIEDFSLKHFHDLYNYSGMENLKRLELVNFKYSAFPQFIDLITRKVELIVKGLVGFCYILYLVRHEGLEISYPKVTVAIHKPNPWSISHHRIKDNVKIIPLEKWEYNPFIIS
ncbi:hypothetical protein DFJ63DRAFT_311819 [Scheffersomyces coipomensis]|uniref:uncharacterized protein n=1 Tax=Scheffersomyces coipomensis TaxID=1788519 RepID=UPI00315C8E55